MEKIIVLNDEGKSTYEMAELLGIARSTIVSRMKKAGIASKYTEIRLSKAHLCLECGETDASKFYGKLKSQCKQCHNEYVNERHRKTRQAGIDFLGGKCSECGYNKCAKALEFHHTDPLVKDSNFKTSRGWSVKRLLKELETCVLLCANCHREVHDV